MKEKVFKLIYRIFPILMLSACGNNEIVIADYSIVPMPQQINQSTDNPFILNKNTKIVYSSNNEGEKQIAEFLAEYIKLSSGIDLTTTDKTENKNVILLQTGYNSDKPESYSLTVNKDHIIINGKDKAGLFYGVQTLRKSIPTSSQNTDLQFPPVEIKDYPRFSYRGMHLDVSRHFFPVEFVKKYIDLLALHNINRLHWHLTDDQGWRVEIKKYPELSKIGSQRARTALGKHTGRYEEKTYGGYYTQEEIKGVVEYARERYITIIPEIDLPGHMLAVLATFPSLGCTGGPYKVAETWGIFEDVLCAGNDDIYPFLEDIFTEIVDLFPSEYIHVGGDECLKTRWEKCPKCQAKIKELGFRDDAKHTAEQHLQSHVIRKVEAFLNSKGRQIIGWDEILEGGIAPNATIMSWRGMEGGIEAAKQHHNVIMTPTAYCYLDYYQTKNTEDETYGIGGYVSVEKVYSLDPLPAELSPEQRKYIIGTQANIWTEYMREPDHVEYMALPRMGAMSEVQWTEQSKRDYKDFLPRLAKMTQLYGKLGYKYSTEIFDVDENIELNKEDKEIKVTLSTFDNAPIYYTLDGTNPTQSSNLYTLPISIKAKENLKAVTIRDTGESRILERTFDINKATFKDITLLTPPRPRYIYHGPSTLVDGIKGSNVFSTGEWIEYIQDLVAVIDLGNIQQISNVTTGTMIDIVNSIYGASEYNVYLSKDNKTFKKVFNESYPELKQDQPKEQRYITASFAPEETRYVKVEVKNVKSMPDWSPFKGQNALLCVDEVIVE